MESRHQHDTLDQIREHLESIRGDRLQQDGGGLPNWRALLDSNREHAVAALAILDFKPLDSDLPETGEYYPPTAT